MAKKVVKMGATTRRKGIGRATSFLGEEVTDFIEATIANAPIGMYIVQDRVFRVVNRHFLEYTGYTEDELRGTDPLLLVHPEDRGMVRDNAVKMLKGERTAPYEYRSVTRKGEVRWVMEAVASISFQGERAILGYYMDFTEHKGIDDALRRSEERYRSTLDGMMEGCQVIGFDWRYLYINDAAAAQGRRAKEELLGRTMMEMYAGIEDTEMFAGLRQFM
jgi:PAS domain S-box-containing protein